MKKILPIAICAVILSVSLFTIAYAKEFSDVPASHWAFTYINELSDKGVIKGYDNGTFNPSGKITRAEYIKLLVSSIASAKEEEEIVASLGSYSNWFEPYVNYAKDKNLLLKDYSIDELKGNVSRSEMAQLLVSFAKYIGLGLETGDIDLLDADITGTLPSEVVGAKEISEEELKKAYDVEEGEELIIANNLNDLVTPSKTEGTFIDDGDVNNNAEEAIFTDILGLTPDEQSAIELAVKLGLVSGYDDGSFKPNNEMTRAEVATIIYRFAQSFTKQVVEIITPE